MHLTRLHPYFLFLALTLCLLCLPLRIQAATLTVTNTNDSGAGSLRQAIADAIPGDTITFAVTGTITLASELAIDKDLTIQGPGANLLTISGNNAVRIFNIGSITPAINITLSGLTIANGKVTGSSVFGGGIANFSTLTLNVTNSTLTNNSATATVGNNRRGDGGGIFNNIGTVNVTNSTLTNNSATATGGSNNSGYGGGIFNHTGTVNVTNSTLTNNSATATGGSNNFGRGGGIFNSFLGILGTVNVTNSTLTNNSATATGGSNNEAWGGGIFNDILSTVNVTNSTLANNSATATGGSMTNVGYGGGIYIFGGTVNVKSTIVALNSVTGSSVMAGPDVIGTFTSQGYNLIGKRDGSTGFTNGSMQDQIGSIAMPIDPLLGPLANNGGPTQTMALLPGSPALDKGISNGLPTDQRGFARTLDFPAISNAAGGDGTDIGAVEGVASMLAVQVGDPAVCLDPNGLVGVTVTVNNPNPIAAVSSFTATLPTGLTAVAGTCVADTPGLCTIAPNGGAVTWNGNLNAGQTVTIIYRARIGANIAQGAQLCLDNTAIVAGVMAPLQYCFNVICPAIVNTRVSDQKAGSVLVFPYYTSTIGGASDTRLTISNISNAASTVANQAYVHLFFIDGTSCQQSDLFLCLTPNASFSFKASDYDPGNTGYLIAVAVNNQGVPIQNNVLIGNAFVNTPEFADNYGAESFRANSFAVATVNGDSATLYFDQVGYDAVPKQFAVEIQSPFNAAGQQVVTAGLSGNLVSSSLSGAAQVGTGLIYNGNEKPFGSFSAWLTGTCQAKGTILTNSPRVPNGMAVMVPSGQTGTMKFNVGAAVGLLLTPRTATWKGIRTLHKTQTTATTLTIPLFVPVC